jgi:hypothetical protein
MYTFKIVTTLIFTAHSNKRACYRTNTPKQLQPTNERAQAQVPPAEWNATSKNNLWLMVSRSNHSLDSTYNFAILNLN